MSRFFLPFDNLERLIVESIESSDTDFIDFFNSYVLNINISELDLKIKTTTSGDIKNTFKKFILDFSKYSQLSEDIILDKINDFIIQNNINEPKYQQFESNICNFLNLR